MPSYLLPKLLRKEKKGGGGHHFYDKSNEFVDSSIPKIPNRQRYRAPSQLETDNNRERRGEESRLS